MTSPSESMDTGASETEHRSPTLAVSSYPSDSSPGADGSPAKRSRQALPITLETLREVLRGEMTEALQQERQNLKAELQDALTSVSARVTSLEQGMEDRHREVRGAIAEIKADQDSAGDQIQTVTQQYARLETHMNMLEKKLRDLEHRGPEEDKRTAVLLGGWSPDTPAAQVKELAQQMANTLKLDVDMAPAFAPGLHRGFVIVPVAKRGGEDELGLRQRIQQALARVNQANIELGRRPDAGIARLWMRLSQPPAKRKRAMLAGKFKRLLLEQGAERSEVETEFGTGTVWHRGHKVCAATTAPTTGDTTQALTGWIDLAGISSALGRNTDNLTMAWQSLVEGIN